MTYAAGFDCGERTAYAHRRDAHRHQRPVRTVGEYQRGWWDGYCPRSAAWATAKRQVIESDGEVVQEVDRGL